MIVGVLRNKGAVADALIPNIVDRVVTDLQQSIGEDEQVGRYSQHGPLSTYILNKLLDLLVGKAGRRGQGHHLIENTANLFNFLGHLIKVRITIALKALHNI